MKHLVVASVLLLIPSGLARATQNPAGETPALGSVRIQQIQIESGQFSLQELRRAGLKIFATNFNKLDGLGDGPMNPFDPKSPGGRPTLQNNGMFLRVNGLDSQSCMECHSVGSSTTAPFTFAIGGVGGSNNNALFQPNTIDVLDNQGNGFAFYDGRYINPPFLFGSGGVELLGKEMTIQLQLIKTIAFAIPGVWVPLKAKGVSFGSIMYNAQTSSFDESRIEGIDSDLVVRPFGRKGEFSTVRGFDLGALNFHLGMQPVEVVGQGVDGDGDGVVDEVLVGEVSALHIFNTNLERPQAGDGSPSSIRGFATFTQVGCAQCHVPELTSGQRLLTYSFPEDELNPLANIYYAADLNQSPAGFALVPGGGLSVPLFSDLKRHDMGPALAESFGSPLDAQFVTARLWGIADTAPYLHDGRATTLTEAIELHGGEGQAARDAFVALTDADKINLLTFLRTLRTPKDPATDL